MKSVEQIISEVRRVLSDEEAPPKAKILQHGEIMRVPMAMQDSVQRAVAADTRESARDAMIANLNTAWRGAPAGERASAPTTTPSPAVITTDGREAAHAKMVADMCNRWRAHA